jgi:hypothetical protein
MPYFLIKTYGGELIQAITMRFSGKSVVVTNLNLDRQEICWSNIESITIEYEEHAP